VHTWTLLAVCLVRGSPLKPQNPKATQSIKPCFVQGVYFAPFGEIEKKGGNNEPTFRAFKRRSPTRYSFLNSSRSREERKKEGVKHSKKGGNGQQKGG